MARPRGRTQVTIRPDKGNLTGRQVAATVLNALLKEQERIQKKFEETVETWEGDRPEFPIARRNKGMVKYKSGRMVIYYGAKVGNDLGYYKWTWLDEGFERHVKLSEDWESKTWPGRWRAEKGFGEVVGRLDQPIPVLAREWEKQMREQVKLTLKYVVEQAIDDMIRKKGK